MPKPYLDRKFYGRRKGRAMGKKRARLVEGLLPTIEIDFDKGATGLDPQSFFDAPKKEIWFEVGFGQGEHLAALAKQNPDIGFIGCEPFMNGVSSLLVQVEDEGLENVRIWPNDARDLMDALTDDCFDRGFLIHPDPWHKLRHNKRRFIQSETANSLARLLKTGAKFEVATDDQPLCDWMLGVLYNHPKFEWQARNAQDWRAKPEDWPVLTKYGEKRLAGIPVYMEFLRVV